MTKLLKMIDSFRDLLIYSNLQLFIASVTKVGNPVPDFASKLSNELISRKKCMGNILHSKSCNKYGSLDLTKAAR